MEIKVLVADDELPARGELKYQLASMPHVNVIGECANGKEVISFLETHPQVDLLFLDIEMPIMDGYEMVKRIREVDKETPIIFSSGLVSPKNVLKGYELGANNYIKKPFIPEELDAHIHALLKLSKGEKSKDESECYKIGKEYVLDATHAILKHSSGENKTLTAREAGLLQMLCENRGDVVRREAILDKFWNTEDDYFASRSLDVFVTKLRKLIAEDSSVSIKTVKGVGLMLEENI